MCHHSAWGCRHSLVILGCATRVFGRQVVLVANVRPSMLHPICLRVIGVRKAVWLSGALIVPVLSHGLSIIVIAGRTFTTTLWSHAPVAAAFLRMLRNASRTFRAGTGPSGPQSVTCPSGPLNQAADGRRHFYWYLPDNAPFVFWRPRGMFSITSCLHIACHRLWA